MTLIELIMAMAVLSFALLGFMYTLVNMGILIHHNRQKTVAINDAQAVLGEMRRLRSQPNVQFPDDIVSTFPNGEAVDGFANLPGEQVVVRYRDPNSNPLVVTVDVSWRSHCGVTMSTQLSTIISEL